MSKLHCMRFQFEILYTCDAAMMKFSQWSVTHGWMILNKQSDIFVGFDRCHASFVDSYFSMVIYQAHICLSHHGMTFAAKLLFSKLHKFYAKTCHRPYFLADVESFLKKLILFSTWKYLTKTLQISLVWKVNTVNIIFSSV